MTQFMQTHKVYLTPISPIHIGCGEDFEPTNYVIRENKLYLFEASKLNLPESFRQQLIKICKEISSDSIQEIQKFFSQEDVINLAIDKSYSTILVSSHIAKEWEKKLGVVSKIKCDGSKDFNALEISRHSYLPYSYKPYIPASSLKGAVITAILDSKNRSDVNKNLYVLPSEVNNKKYYDEKCKKLNKELQYKYIGDFSLLKDADEKILSQRIKFSDFVPEKDQILSRVMYAVNVKKKAGKDGSVVKKLNTRRECILPMIFRSFSSSLTLLNERNEEKLDIKMLISQLNEFNLPILKEECQLLACNGIFNDRNYVENIKLILEQNDNVALIRLGRSGSETKMYSNDNLRSVKVKGEPSQSSHTLWIASDSQEKSETMQPFGWALLEFIKDNETNEMLQEWCNNTKRSLKHYLEELKLEKEMEKERKELNALPETQRKIIELENKFKSSSEKQIDSSSSLLKEVKELIEKEAIHWKKEDKQFMQEKITKDLILTRVELKKKNADKELNKLLNKLVAE